jgi:glucosylceramidase
MKRRNIIIAVACSVLFVYGDCSKKTTPPTTPPVNPPQAANEVDMWLTKADQTALLQKQSQTLSFAAISNGFSTIETDSATTYQGIEGFGYTLTGSSAYLINRMDAASRAALLSEVFGSGSNSVGVSYLRISIGASDLSPEVFSYNDLPAGQTDPTLSNFSLSKDTVDLIPVLKTILAINPSIKIMGTPWSAPVWMKTNGSSIGGSLQTIYYGAYASYLVKYIQQMQARGIPLHAITVQNEPEYGGNNPSMLMTAPQQADFIKNHLGPAFRAAGIATKIIIFDHNCDNPNYPVSILNDPAAKQFISGSAFHLYAGDISALSTVHLAHPDRDLYFTEQYTGANGSFDGDLKWHLKNVIIGSLNNWSRVVLEWNFASDVNYGPRTPGGCSDCKGAVTINGSLVNRNVSYYIIAQIARFVPPGSVRIQSTPIANLLSVAFKTPAGKKVLLVLNEQASAQGFNIGYKGKKVFTSLPGNAVATYIW